MRWRICILLSSPLFDQSHEGPVTIYYSLRCDSPTWNSRSPYLYPPGTRWPSYAPGHWVPFSSPPTTTHFWNFISSDVLPLPSHCTFLSLRGPLRVERPKGLLLLVYLSPRIMFAESLHKRGTYYSSSIPSCPEDTDTDSKMILCYFHIFQNKDDRLQLLLCYSQLDNLSSFIYFPLNESNAKNDPQNKLLDTVLCIILLSVISCRPFSLPSLKSCKGSSPPHECYAPPWSTCSNDGLLGDDCVSWRFSLCNGNSWVSALCHRPELQVLEKNVSENVCFRNFMFSIIQKSGRGIIARNPVILSFIHHHQNPLYSYYSFLPILLVKQ
jgi:hypothetical protein